MSSSIDSSYSSEKSAVTDSSEQTFAATSFDICQIVRSEKPPTVPTKMELRCDGFEVVRTKHNTGFDECLRKLDEARDKLNNMKMESSKSTALTYDSYTLAHEREKERRKKVRMTRYEREKDHRTQLGIQHYQNKLDDIKETSPRDKDSVGFLSNEMSRCKETLNDISPMVSSSLSSENSPDKRVEQSSDRRKRRSSSRSSSKYRNGSESKKPREEKSSSWFDSFLPFFASASTNSTFFELERKTGGDHLKYNSIPRNVSVPTASIRKNHPAPLVIAQDEAKEKQNNALEIKAVSVEKEGAVDSKHVGNSRKEIHIQEEAKKKQGNEEHVLSIKSVSESKETAVDSKYVGNSREKAHIQEKTKKKQSNEENAFAAKQKTEETWTIKSEISGKANLKYIGSYYTTDSSSISSKSFRLRRMPREALKQKALEVLANSSSNSSYSEPMIKYEEVEKPTIIRSSEKSNDATHDSNNNSNEKVASKEVPILDIIQRAPSETPCKAELVTEKISESFEDESFKNKRRLHRTSKSFPRPPRLPDHKSDDSPRKKKSCSKSVDYFSHISSLESDESQVITAKEANPYGKVQLIHKTPTGLSSSTINTSSVHGQMDNVVITFSNGSNSTDSENSRGSRRQRHYSEGEESRDDCSLEPLEAFTIADGAPPNAFLGAEIATCPDETAKRIRDDCSSLEPLEPFTIADGAPLNAFLGAR